LADYVSWVYQELGLPGRGVLPGQYITIRDSNKVRIDFVLPPILQPERIDYRIVDWLEAFLELRSSDYVTIPVLTNWTQDYKPVQISEEFLSPKTPWIQLLEDLECLELEMIKETIQLTTYANRRSVYRLFIKGVKLPIAYRCRVVRNIPEVFDVFFLGPPDVEAYGHSTLF
jgi:hypothetical protein